MSQFYINSVKRKMKWQRLDLENLQDHDSNVPGAGSNSISDNIRNQDSSEREQAITELRSSLENDFAHILRPRKHKLSEDFKRSNNFENEVFTENENNFCSQASTALEQIENIAGIKGSKQINSEKEEIEKSPEALLGMISELRILTEKRTKIKTNLTNIDNDLIKLQERIIEDKKLYEEKIAHLQSINEIYSQSSRLVSKIISEESDYEQL